MRAKNSVGLTPRERLGRGLTYTAIGPVDVTRGVVGLSAHSARAGVSNLRRRYHEGRLARDLQQTLAQELATAQQVVNRLPDAVAKVRGPRRGRPRPWVLAGAAAGVLAVGAGAFSVIRRRSQPEPSHLPPSVDVNHRP